MRRRSGAGRPQQRELPEQSSGQGVPDQRASAEADDLAGPTPPDAQPRGWFVELIGHFNDPDWVDGASTMIVVGCLPLILILAILAFGLVLAGTVSVPAAALGAGGAGTVAAGGAAIQWWRHRRKQQDDPPSS